MKKNLINELKNEHIELLKLIDEISQANLSLADIQKKLFSVKDVLLAHLNKEDLELYPILNKESETNSQLKKYLEVFAKDMQEITSRVISFFGKYEKDIDYITFTNDLADIKMNLKIRIGKEERVLYKEYEKLLSASI